MACVLTPPSSGTMYWHTGVLDNVDLLYNYRVPIFWKSREFCFDWNIGELSWNFAVCWGIMLC